jgi:hypothetical protein
MTGSVCCKYPVFRSAAAVCHVALVALVDQLGSLEPNALAAEPTVTIDRIEQFLKQMSLFLVAQHQLVSGDDAVDIRANLQTVLTAVVNFALSCASPARVLDATHTLLLLTNNAAPAAPTTALALQLPPPRSLQALLSHTRSPSLHKIDSALRLGALVAHRTDELGGSGLNVTRGCCS